MQQELTLAFRFRFGNFFYINVIDWIIPNLCILQLFEASIKDLRESRHEFIDGCDFQHGCLILQGVVSNHTIIIEGVWSFLGASLDPDHASILRAIAGNRD